MSLRGCRKKLPKLPNYDLVCPHCGKPVVYQFGKLEAIKQSLSAEEREKLEQQILDADNAVSKAERELNAAKHDFILADSDLQAIKKAKEELLQQNGGGYRCPMPPEIMPTL